ncbi:MAG TPA: diguanylate cyclase [Thiotrichales bacterium]|nr:diguanylate cyclase [Thiotrichales bacterium]
MSGSSMHDLHWQLEMLQSIDVGLTVIDRDYRVVLWNGFMANHSGKAPEEVIGKPLFELFPEIPVEWFRRKAESVFLLNSRAFVTWEQRPYLFRFRNYRPITGASELMYQNVTLIPLTGSDGRVNQVGIIIYDVTDTAVGKLELREANRRFKELSRTDHLTQLHNRGYWEGRVEEEFRRVQRSGRPSSLVMFDIDHFKKINDGYGHPAGDEVIRSTAQALRDSIRATDIAGRYGGEEFGVVLLDSAAEDAAQVAERLRQRIEALEVRYQDFRIRYTISLGVAGVNEEMSSHEAWIDCADQALYEAKEGGRNQVVIYRP